MGERPAVLVIDFSCGFTDPECALGSELTAEVEATRRVLEAARAKGLPVVFTTIGFEPNRKDGGLWMQKVPALADLQIGWQVGRHRPAARAARRRDGDREEGSLRLLRHEPRLGARDAEGRLGDPLRRDDERLHPCDRDRPAPVRVADDRAARVRRRPSPGAARRRTCSTSRRSTPTSSRSTRRSAIWRAYGRRWVRPREQAGRRPRRRRGRSRGDRRGPARGRRVGPRARLDQAFRGGVPSTTSTGR